MFFPRRSRPDASLSALAGELRRAQRDLAAAYGQFNQATSPELIESCVYRINDERARCDYLLRAVKRRQSAETVRS